MFWQCLGAAIGPSRRLAAMTRAEAFYEHYGFVRLPVSQNYSKNNISTPAAAS
jgi:hypothetical protein